MHKIVKVKLIINHKVNIVNSPLQNILRPMCRALGE